MWELPSLSGVLSGVGTRLEHSWMSTQMPAGRLWFPQIPGFELPSSMYVLLPPDGSHVVRHSPVQTNMQRPLQVHVVGTLPSPGIFKPAMLLVLGDCEPLGRWTEGGYEARLVQAFSAQHMLRVVKHPASGSLTRKTDKLPLCTEYLTQRGLVSHFWLSGTRTKRYGNRHIRDFPSSVAVAGRQRAPTECSCTSTYA